MGIKKHMRFVCTRDVCLSDLEVQLQVKTKISDNWRTLFCRLWLKYYPKLEFFLCR